MKHLKSPKVIGIFVLQIATIIAASISLPFWVIIFSSLAVIVLVVLVVKQDEDTQEKLKGENTQDHTQLAEVMEYTQLLDEAFVQISE